MIRIVIVDDHPALAEAMALLLGSEPDLRVDGVATDAGRAARMIEELAPDVVLCDVMLHGRDAGFDLLAKADGRTRFLMFTGYDYPAFRVRAIKGGAAGYLTKLTDAKTIAATIRRIHAGSRGFSPDVLRTLTQAVPPPTRREMQLLEQLGEGATNDEIAAALGIRSKTVEGMLRRLFDRYAVDNRTQLVRYAARQGWLESWMPGQAS
jgi:two-component system NarL family response regulator